MRPAPRSAAVISIVDPFTGDGGKPKVLAGLVRHLTDRLGTDHVHYVLIGGTAIRSDEVRTHHVPGPSTRERLGGLLTRTVPGRAPMQEGLLWSPTVRRDLGDLLRRLDVDLQVYDTVRTGQLAPLGHPGLRVCYLDDLMSLRYRRMLDAVRRLPDVQVDALGTFADQIPGPLRPVARNQAVQRLLMRVESGLSARSEVRAAREFDRCLLVSAREAETLTRTAGVAEGRVVELPPSLPIRSAVARDVPAEPRFVFLGLLSAPHNDDGLTHLLREVWPAVLDRLPKARLQVVGRDPSPAARELLARHADTVELEGFVPDLDSVLARSTALLNVLRFGTGVKIKIIEALARGLPVLSTTLGAEGVRSGAGSGIVVADGPADLAAAAALLAEPEHNLRLSEEAGGHFRRRYAQDAVNETYDRALGLV
ncbi:hypothetical protein GCM10009836_46660 [Pseudonocardia ailaonensis]|uniref:Glycosyltransferase n=1 Tax=Pseudonocardia ailaonensis TaxID=367279 RepID=A0ABN2NB05_9PSEU